MKLKDILYLVIIMLSIYLIYKVFIQNGNDRPDDMTPPSASFAEENHINEDPEDKEFNFFEYVGLPDPEDESTEAMSEPVINARSAIVMDFETGNILYEKNAYRKRPMASTTKIMTAIIALENSDLNDDVLISQRAANMGGSVMGLKKDTIVKMKDLLHGLLICSGNDAAVAIAEHVAGSVDAFCELMNEKALELGAYSTSFANPHGLDAENHYTTAYDLAKITRYALKNPVFNDIVRKTEFYFDGKVLKTTNEMLTSYAGADGVKTGYTGLAGRCLVTSATRDDKRFISVVLFCDTKNLRTTSSQKILDYAFSEFEKIFLLEKGRILGSVKVDRSRSLGEVIVAAAEDLKTVLKRDEVDSLYTRVSLPEKVEAPVRQGTIMGTVSIFQGDRIIAETSLIAMNSAQRMRFSDYMSIAIKKWIHISR